MFPIVSCSSRNTISPSTSGIISNYVTVPSKLPVLGKVMAATNIIQGAMSAPIDPAFLLGKPDLPLLTVGLNSIGMIEVEPNSRSVWSKNSHWVRAIRLSDDCHSYNVELRLYPAQRACSTLNKNLPTPKLILQAVRTIEIGQELSLWFSEDILAMLQIVFLTPANIQGQNRYVCNRCLSLYESPNPLKLHMTLGCGKHDIGIVWHKLSTMLRENSLHNVFVQKCFDFKLSPTQPLSRQKSAIDLTTSGNKKCDSPKELYRPYSEPSAFKPFKKEESSPTKEIPTVWPLSFKHHELLQKQLPDFDKCSGVPSYEDDAHIETLVSSLGKTDDGHVCLYCGKCYSRKYGLKIHIRTHTGYKPLKCKFCGRPFGDPSNLNKHVRLHAEGNTPYKCDLCGKILVRRRDLERHLKSRHMIDMHPDLNVLPDSPNGDDEISEDGSTRSSNTT